MGNKQLSQQVLKISLAQSKKGTFKRKTHPINTKQRTQNGKQTPVNLRKNE